MKLRTSLAVITIALTLPGTAPAHDTPVAQDRSVEPVVLTGSQFPQWSAGPDPTFREPGVPTNYDTADVQAMLPEPLRSECYDPGSNEWDPEDPGDHNCYQSSRLPRNPIEGEPVDRLMGFRWSGETWEQIPFQVDERFTRYLSNNVSDFAFYSTVDQHNTFAFDREGFRFTDNDPDDVCRPRPRAEADGSRPETMPDPVVGLDDDDELVFMWRDAGDQAPPSTPLPDGIEGAAEVLVADPSNPENVAFAYVMLASEDGPAPAFTAENSPYVRYERDTGPNRLGADLFVYSQSSYSGYGLAPHGPYCDAATGDPVMDTDGRYDIKQRRPLDTAWVSTPRYAFRYEGRWLMTELRVSDDAEGDWSYGPDIVDQWKARAFQQRPGGQTPCCGYEEEVNNWGGSSILMGERAGPVRVIRATWGADSSTNNIRMEIFYRDEIRFIDYLRVHPIPPLDGIYVQWDYNATKVERYYNPWVPDGVAIDGQNDEVFGNTFVHVAKDKIEVRDDDPVPVTGPVSVTVPLGGEYENCRIREIDNQRSMCNDIDIHDPTFSGPTDDLNWEQIAGPYGSVVTRWTVHEHTAGGTPQAIAAQPYYRDDSCFDDGTGTDPGPHLRSRNVDDGPFALYTDPETGEELARECWTPDHGDPAADPAGPRRFWQGSIATHGLHLHVIADSDNAGMTVPLTEIDSEQRMVVLPGDPGNVGERYGRSVEFPIATLARPYA